MNFKIGQPVWAKSHCTQEISAAVVVGIYDHPEVTCHTCGLVRHVGFSYQISFEDGRALPKNPKYLNWAREEPLLSPRDADQFKAADEYFELPIKCTAPSEPGVKNG